MAARAPRVFRERVNWMDRLNEKEIVEKYRLTSNRINWLLNLIVHDIQPNTLRSHAIDATTKLLVTLQFLAKGEFFSEGSLVHGISKSSLCRHIWQVIEAIDRRLNNINFPRQPNELTVLKRKFYDLQRIPNCIGAIDCTLIPISSPNVREDLYVCRKGYHAINVQAVVDTEMRFTNIVARWPGSTHDNTIFTNSSLKRWLDGGDYGWLVGDSGYGLSRYMLTPKVI